MATGPANEEAGSIEGSSESCNRQDLESGLANCRLRAAFYKKVIERYSQEISAGEQKTVPELKALVDSADACVERIRRELLEKRGLREGLGAGEQEYEFERDFLSFAQDAHAFVQGLAPLHAELSLPFWLRPAEMLELGAADVFDRALFLCSLLMAGGCSKALVRVLELSGGAVHPVVVFSYNDKIHVQDAAPGGSALVAGGSLEEALAEFRYEGQNVQKSLYEFNQAEYTEFD